MKMPTPLPAIALLVLSACGSPAPPGEITLSEIPFPGGGETLAPRLSNEKGQPVLLSWLERGQEGATLWVSRYAGGRWETPVKVVSDAKMFVNWADFPSVSALDGQHWIAHWLSYSAPRTYAYDVRISQSFDSGASWLPFVTPHSDGTPTEHGFVSSWKEGDYVGFLWLDGRNMALDEDPEGSHHGMTLRTALIDAHGSVTGQSIVDDLVCDCCQTDVAFGIKGPVAVYRDRTPDEIRDIAVSRKINGHWVNSRPSWDDGWQIAACPVNGPAIDAHHNAMATAWFTAADEMPKVKIAFSKDTGETFDRPMDVAGANVLGHVGIAHVSEATFVVSWMELDGERFAIRLQLFSPAGPVDKAMTVATSASRFQVPQTVVVDGVVLVAWTDENDDVSSVRTAKLPL